MNSITDNEESAVISTKQTTSDFLREKLDNFQRFLIENLPNEGLRKQVEAISALQLPLIYAWITQELQVQADLGQYVDKLFEKYEIDKSTVSTDTREKVKRYFECFIACA